MHQQDFAKLPTRSKVLCQALSTDAAGRVFVEYLVLLLIGIGVVVIAGGIVGRKMVTDYSERNAILNSTYP